MITCGFWITARRLVVVVADSGKPASAITAARTDDAQHSLLHHLHDRYGPDCALVLPAQLASASIASLALRRGITVWVAPRILLDGLQMIASVGRTASPRRLARLLAHLPRSDLLRQHLQRLPTNEQQLRLL